jgi:hypothetical protein
MSKTPGNWKQLPATTKPTMNEFIAPQHETHELGAHVNKQSSLVGKVNSQRRQKNKTWPDHDIKPQLSQLSVFSNME